MENTAADTAKTSTATFSKEHLESEMHKDESDCIHSCEFCGTNFETRPGLSSHARFHLRQLGVAVSDSSGAPIDFLSKLMKEKGRTLPKFKKQAKPVKKFKHKSQVQAKPAKKNKLQSHVLKKKPGPKLKIKISNLVKKKYALSSSSAPSAVKGSTGPTFTVGKTCKTSSKKIVVSNPAASSLPKALESRIGDSSPSTSLSLASAKPLWAPQETDAPLNLTTMTNPTQREDVHVCELCGAWYETRKGLSSHARSHLRQFGMHLDSKGAPIEMLHKIIQSEDFQEKASGGLLDISGIEDRTSHTSAPSTSSSTSKNPSPSSLVFKRLTSIRLIPPPVKKQNVSLHVSGNSPLSKKAQFKSTVSAKKKKISLDFSGNMPPSGQTELKSPSRKKKKLSPDVLGILPFSGKAESKSSPPAKKQKVSADVSEALPLIEKTELKSTPSVKKHKISSDASASLPLGDQAELKSRCHGESSKSVKCEFCHEKFKKSQSLASHARYHLRQLGITEWSVKGSPMATLREVMARQTATTGSLSTLEPPSLSPLTQSTSPSAPPSGPPLLLTPEPPSSSPRPVPHKVPKAKKGFRTVIPKTKDEPVEVDVSIIESPKSQSAPITPLTPVSDSNAVKSSVTAPKPENQEPKQFVCCDYCGEMFDTRKALSCHARSHLRQLGAKWSVKFPPIEALYELMRREGTVRASQIKPESALAASVQFKKQATSPPKLILSPVEKEKPAEDGTGCDATCELCGFDFENRKALASHARAHLRQQGVDWKVHGSPIETLMAWMKSEPRKVAELHKSYMRGQLPFVKKVPRKTSTPYSSTDSESVRLGSPKASSRDSAGQPQVSQHSKAARDGKAGMTHYSPHKKRPPSDELSSDSLVQTPTARSELNVRLPRGFERRPTKHSSHSESRSGETEPSKPPRVGNIPSLVPRPPETSLVKLVGKIYSLKCRFCEEVFHGPLSIQEDWVMHLQQHILKLKQDSSAGSSAQPPLSQPETPLLIGPQAV
ncbi:protein Wiz isoform X2 [Danio aesculapii]|uniref:protein Wiz isoform X2 n=1 Tax=Danio aesculapii TaxID=1142201 RepID=UPI0024BF7C21|nr:protein Wiz isoform X2 [Danio aesculapii]